MVTTEADLALGTVYSEAETAPNLAGFLVTICVVCLYVLVVLAWHVGIGGDALLAAALIGVLFRVPHTVAIWAALTLLVPTAVALGVNNSLVAESLANYAYYGLVVGCLWAIWNMAAERFHWNMPATVLFEHAKRQVNSPSPLLFLAVLALFLAVAGAISTGTGVPAGGLLALLAIFGLVRHPYYRFILSCGVTLIVLASIQFLGGDQSLATLTGLLGCGAFGTALLWFVCRVLPARFNKYRSQPLSDAPTPGNGHADDRRREQESEHTMADV